VRFADVDLNEDEDMEPPEAESADDSDGEEEEGEDDEFIDLLDVLDGKGEVDNGSDTETLPKPSTKTIKRPTSRVSDEDNNQLGDRGEEDEEIVEDESEEDESEEESDDDKFRLSPSDSEDVAPEALDELQNFISKLDPSAKKRKAPADSEGTQALDQSRKQRRVTIKERTEAGAENEFRAQTSGALRYFSLLILDSNA
jgi:U3 small nucleolar RNA-associated protein 14